MRSSVLESWKRIEAWLRANCLPACFSLPPGASDENIRAAEAEIGLELPLVVRESYRIHDGTGRIRVFEQGFVMPLAGAPDYTVVSIWNAMREVGEQMRDESGNPRGPIRSDWWHPGWVPLTENEEGDTICVDLAPAEGGRVGQIIDRAHYGDSQVLAASWDDWLAAHVVALESGHYRLYANEASLWAGIELASESTE